MFRKVVTGIVLLGLGTGLLSLTNWGSYLKTGYRQVVELVQNRVPVDFQIERAKDLVKQLENDIRTVAEKVTVQELAVHRLSEEIQQTEGKLAKQTSRILTYKGMLKDQLASYEVDGTKFTRKQVEDSLVRAFNQFEVTEANLTASKELHQDKLLQLEETRQHLETLAAERKRLQLEIQRLEMQLDKQKMRHTSQPVEDGKEVLREAQQTIENIRTKLNQQDRVNDLMNKYLDHQVEQQESNLDTLKKIEERFGAVQESAPTDL